MTEQLPTNLTVIVPAYNEAKRIPQTLQAISQFFASKDLIIEILVIDDGSKDQTRTLAEELNLPNLRVISYYPNRGKGYAIQTGVNEARGDWILFTDADNSTPIEEFDKLWQEAGRYQVIIGSRYLPGSLITVKQPTPRIILSRLGNLLVQTLLLPGVRDTQCGFKLFSQAAARLIFARQIIFGWGFDMEILRIAREFGFKIKEVPIVWRNDDQSRIQSSQVFVKTLSELLTIKKNSWLGRYNPRRHPKLANRD